MLQPGIPGKGKILNQLSNFWFERLADVVPHHLLATDPADSPAAPAPREQLAGRAVLVSKARVVPFECVARGYLAGSGFKEYPAGGAVCGIPLPPGSSAPAGCPSRSSPPPPRPRRATTRTSASSAWRRRRRRARRAPARPDPGSLRRAAEHAAERGLILADTKFEFGLAERRLLLVDEVLTPDSSRYWEAAPWRPGEEPASFDKQYVRNWLDGSGWDHESPPPVLPDEVVQGTRDRYLEAFRRITGREPEL